MKNELHPGPDLTREIMEFEICRRLASFEFYLHIFKRFPYILSLRSPIQISVISQDYCKQGLILLYL